MLLVEYDAKNRLKKVIDPLLGETVYTYDGNGNLLTVKDAKNQVTTFAYDGAQKRGRESFIDSITAVLGEDCPCLVALVLPLEISRIMS